MVKWNRIRLLTASVSMKSLSRNTFPLIICFCVAVLSTRSVMTTSVSAD